MYQSHTQSSFKENLIIFLISALLSWRIIRSVITINFIWNLHYIFFMIAFSLSVFLIFYKKRHNKIIFAGIGLLLLNVNSLFLNGFFDSQFLFSIVIFNCLCFVLYIVENQKVNWIRITEKVMIALLLVQLFCILDIFNSWRLIDYGYIESKTGVPNIGSKGATKLLMLFGIDNMMIVRVSGISGTPYGSGGLVAAISAYFFYTENYKIFTLSLIVLILISSLSSIVALFFVLFFLSGKMFLPISLMVVPASYIIITGYVNIIAGIPFLDVLKIFTNLTYNGNHTNAIYIMSSLIGEGRLSGFVQSELRIINLFFSLGFFGSLIFFYIALKLKTYVKISDSTNLKLKGFLVFLVTLLTANWHYHSLLVFPNIAIVVLMVSIIINDYNKHQSV